MSFLREYLPIFNRRKRWLPVDVERRQRSSVLDQDRESVEEITQVVRGLGDQSTHLTLVAKAQRPATEEDDELAESLRALEKVLEDDGPGTANGA